MKDVVEQKQTPSPSSATPRPTRPTYLARRQSHPSEPFATKLSCEYGTGTWISGANENGHENGDGSGCGNGSSSVKHERQSDEQQQQQQQQLVEENVSTGKNSCEEDRDRMEADARVDKQEWEVKEEEENRNWQREATPESPTIGTPNTALRSLELSALPPIERIRCIDNFPVATPTAPGTPDTIHRSHKLGALPSIKHVRHVTRLPIATATTPRTPSTALYAPELTASPHIDRLRPGIHLLPIRPNTSATPNTARRSLEIDALPPIERGRHVTHLPVATPGTPATARPSLELSAFPPIERVRHVTNIPTVELASEQDETPEAKDSIEGAARRKISLNFRQTFKDPGPVADRNAPAYTKKKKSSISIRQMASNARNFPRKVASVAALRKKGSVLGTANHDGSEQQHTLLEHQEIAEDEERVTSALPLSRIPDAFTNGHAKKSASSSEDRNSAGHEAGQRVLRHKHQNVNGMPTHLSSLVRYLDSDGDNGTVARYYIRGEHPRPINDLYSIGNPYSRPSTRETVRSVRSESRLSSRVSSRFLRKIGSASFGRDSSSSTRRLDYLPSAESVGLGMPQGNAPLPPGVIATARRSGGVGVEERGYRRTSQAGEMGGGAAVNRGRPSDDSRSKVGAHAARSSDDSRFTRRWVTEEECRLRGSSKTSSSRPSQPASKVATIGRRQPENAFNCWIVEEARRLKEGGESNGNTTPGDMVLRDTPTTPVPTPTKPAFSPITARKTPSSPVPPLPPPIPRKSSHRLKKSRAPGESSNRSGPSTYPPSNAFREPSSISRPPTHSQSRATRELFSRPSTASLTSDSDSARMTTPKPYRAQQQLKSAPWPYRQQAISAATSRSMLPARSSSLLPPTPPLASPMAPMIRQTRASAMRAALSAQQRKASTSTSASASASVSGRSSRTSDKPLPAAPTAAASAATSTPSHTLTVRPSGSALALASLPNGTNASTGTSTALDFPSFAFPNFPSFAFTSDGADLFVGRLHELMAGIKALVRQGRAERDLERKAVLQRKVEMAMDGVWRVWAAYLHWQRGGEVVEKMMENLEKVVEGMGMEMEE